MGRSIPQPPLQREGVPAAPAESAFVSGRGKCTPEHGRGNAVHSRAVSVRGRPAVIRPSSDKQEWNRGISASVAAFLAQRGLFCILGLCRTNLDAAWCPGKAVPDRRKAGISVFERMKEDIAVIRDRDPASRSTLEVMLLYNGFKARSVPPESQLVFPARAVFSRPLDIPALREADEYRNPSRRYHRPAPVY